MGGDTNTTGNGVSKLVFTILSAVAEAERDRSREAGRRGEARPAPARPVDAGKGDGFCHASRHVDAVSTTGSAFLGCRGAEAGLRWIAWAVARRR